MPLVAVFGVPAAVWLGSLVAVILGLRWGVLARPQRLRPALIATVVSLVIGYLGLTRFRATASKTVNGEVQWRLDSEWFFVASLVLGGVALGLVLWHYWKNRTQPTTAA